MILLNPYSPSTHHNLYLPPKRSSRPLGELMRHTSSLFVPLLCSLGCVKSPPEPTDTSTDTATAHDPSCDDPSALVGLSFINVNNDEWDDLLDELVAHEAADKADDLPDALDWMGGRRIGMSSEDVSQVIDVERLLGWGFSPSLSSVLLL